MSNVRFISIVTLCAALASCDQPTTTRDLTAREVGPSFSTADAAGILEKYAVRADQESPVASMEELLADVAALGDVSASQSSEPTQCVGVFVGTFERVEVPPGATCVLVNSIVRQWVHALELSGLLIANTQIGQNVMGLTARFVQLFDTRVEGHVHIQEAGDPAVASCFMGGSTVLGNFSCNQGNPAAPRIEGPNTIGGSLSVVGNFSPPNFFFNVERNTVGGNTHVNNNEGQNVKRVQLNIIAGTLNCRNNDPPFIGGPNVAERAHGQCF